MSPGMLIGQASIRIFRSMKNFMTTYTHFFVRYVTKRLPIVDEHEPSSMAMTNGIISLCRNPTQFCLIEIRAIVGEIGYGGILRYDPPFTYLGRRTTRPCRLAEKVNWRPSLGMRAAATLILKSYLLQ